MDVALVCMPVALTYLIYTLTINLSAENHNHNFFTRKLGMNHYCLNEALPGSIKCFLLSERHSRQ